MKTTFKKIAAAVSALVLAGSLCGCSDDGYIMTVDGMKIRNGIYLTFQQNSFESATNRLDETDSLVSDGDSDEKYNIFDKSIDGKSFADWVKEDTRKGVLRFVGIQRQCEKFGITLSDEEMAKVHSEVQENWDYQDFYVKWIYGYDTMGAYYESMGISFDSLKEIGVVNALNEKLFLHYYGEGGELAVPDSEIDAYIDENYAGYRMITLSYKDINGNSLSGDAFNALFDDAEEYARRLNNGEKFVDVYYDYDLKANKESARLQAEETYMEMLEAGLVDDDGKTVDGLTEEQFIEKAVESATATKRESDSAFDSVISVNTSGLEEELSDYIFDLPNDKKASVFEGENAVYVVVKLPMSDVKGFREDTLTTILFALKGDSFDSMMDLICQNYKIEQNDYLVDKKYSPEKGYEHFG